MLEGVYERYLCWEGEVLKSEIMERVQLLVIPRLGRSTEVAPEAEGGSFSPESRVWWNGPKY